MAGCRGQGSTLLPRAGLASITSDCIHFAPSPTGSLGNARPLFGRATISGMCRSSTWGLRPTSSHLHVQRRGSPRHGWGKGVGRKPVFVRIEKSKTGGVGKVKSVKDEASLGEAGARPTPSGWPPEKAEMNKRPPTSHPVHIPHPPTPTPATRW